MILLSAVSAPPAAAQEAPKPPPPQQPLRQVVVTASLVQLFLPMLEVTAEARVAPRVGVAATLGAGVGTTDLNGEKFDAFEIGASGRYYARGDFDRGIQVGAELLYSSLRGSELKVAGFPQGLALSPFVGAKVTWRRGVAAEVQLGLSYLVLPRKTYPDVDGDSNFGLLFNVNIGWAF